MGAGGVVAGEGWREAWSLKKMEGRMWSQKDGGRRGHRRMGGVATQEKDGGGVATGEGIQAYMSNK